MNRLARVFVLLAAVVVVASASVWLSTQSNDRPGGRVASMAGASHPAQVTFVLPTDAAPFGERSLRVHTPAQPLSVPTAPARFPRVLVQTYSSNRVPFRMSMAVSSWLQRNPGYEYRFYDDARGRQLIDAKFGREVADAFDCLVPGAFRSDVLRMCALLEHGGFYADISTVCERPLDELQAELPSECELVVVRDSASSTFGVYQAFLGCRPGCPAVARVLRGVVDRVLAVQRSGTVPVKMHQLELTGPHAFGQLLNLGRGRAPDAALVPGAQDEGRLMVLNRESSRGGFVFGPKDERLLRMKYDGWWHDRPRGAHYSQLWREGKVTVPQCELGRCAPDKAAFFVATTSRFLGPARVARLKALGPSVHMADRHERGGLSPEEWGRAMVRTHGGTYLDLAHNLPVGPARDPAMFREESVDDEGRLVMARGRGEKVVTDADAPPRGSPEPEPWEAALA